MPPKPRRLSTSQAHAAPKLGRTVSEEKAEAHERWLPPGASGNASFTYGSTESFASSRDVYGSGREYASTRDGSREKEGSRERGGGYGERGIVNDYERDPRKTPRPPSRVSAAAAGAGFMGFSSAGYAAARLKDLSGRA